jgi:hypothetical protein
VLLALISTDRQQVSAQGTNGPISCQQVERDRLHDLILKQAWGQGGPARLKKSASVGDGFAAAFLYALDGDPRTLPSLNNGC